MNELNDALNLINKYISKPENFLDLMQKGYLGDISEARVILEEVITKISDEAFYSIVDCIERVEDGLGDDEMRENCRLQLDDWDDESVEHFAVWFIALKQCSNFDSGVIKVDTTKAKELFDA